MRKVKEIRRWIEAYESVESAVEEVKLSFDFYKEGVAEEEEVDQAYQVALSLIENVELRNMLRREEDRLGAVLKVNAGAGGTESQDWASMLVRLYQRWAENHDYKVTITNWQDGDEAGIKTVTMQIEGDLAYGFLKSENGVHRLVRVSPYNAQGKRMTSFASVFVVPLVDDSIEIAVNPANLSWDTFRSSGAGGQNVNKVETGVRLHYQFKDPDTGEEREGASHDAGVPDGERVEAAGKDGHFFGTRRGGVVLCRGGGGRGSGHLVPNFSSEVSSKEHFLHKQLNFLLLMNCLLVIFPFFKI